MNGIGGSMPGCAEMEIAMDRVHGIFLDARTHRDKEVVADLGPSTLRILSPDGEIITEWSINRIQMIEPGRYSDRFVVGHIGNDISRLTLFDPNFRKALIKASPGIEESFKEGRLRRFFAWMGWIPREG